MLRERAELYLLHELGVMPGWPEHYAQLPPNELGRRGYERDERAHVLGKFRGAVEVLGALGVLTEGEGSRWLSRFESALEGGQPRGPAPGGDPAIADRARRVLEERLATVAGSEDACAATAGFEDALCAVRVAGALSHEETERWSRRIGEVVPAQNQDALRRRQVRPAAWKGTELKRVIVVPPKRHAGVAITHAELHADGLVIHWHRVAPIELPQGREPTRGERAVAVRAASALTGWPELAVEDDRGTAYRSAPTDRPCYECVHNEDSVVSWAAARFAPGIAQDASELRVRLEGVVFTVALTA